MIKKNQKNNKKKALIFGITGQDGAYLSKLLKNKNYQVYGVTRSKAKSNLYNLVKLDVLKKINLVQFSNFNKKKLYSIILKVKPLEIYYLAGQSSVERSFSNPLDTYTSNNLTLFYILEFCRKFNKKIKVYNSASSECFGNNKEFFCNEKTPFAPISPYGKAKSFSFWLTKYYRENFELKCSNGILFNHESPLRKKTFVTQKISSFAKNYNLRKNKILFLGNTKVIRDWGWANDYVEAIYKVNSSTKNDDYVIGSGISESLYEFVKIIFKEAEIPIKNLKEFSKFKRPQEIIRIGCDNSKIKKTLKWKPKNNLKDIAIKLLKEELY